MQPYLNFEIHLSSYVPLGSPVMICLSFQTRQMELSLNQTRFLQRVSWKKAGHRNGWRQYMQPFSQLVSRQPVFLWPHSASSQPNLPFICSVVASLVYSAHHTSSIVKSLYPDPSHYTAPDPSLLFYISNFFSTVDEAQRKKTEREFRARKKNIIPEGK